MNQQSQKPYRVCTVTVMDTTDPDIRFNEDGVCHYVEEFAQYQASLPSRGKRDQMLIDLIANIKTAGTGKKYDCVLGLSGGVDSSYMAYLAKEWGLRPLVVHFDNGWNSELAVKNIEEIVNRLGFDLATLVMDWSEFRDLQRSYLLASVVDIEVPTDHLIQGALYRLASKNGIKTILSGTNFSTEWLMPRTWNYRKQDLVNLQNIHRKFGQQPLKNSSTYGLSDQIWYTYFKGIRSYPILDYVDYSKSMAKQKLVGELGWRDYGGKHYESIFTRFYQGYILPVKFNIDKRKAHLSNLILTGEISRNYALTELEKPTYEEALQLEDMQYVAKKLQFSKDEFSHIFSAEPVPHEYYGTDLNRRKTYMTWVKRISAAKKSLFGRRIP